MNFSSGNELIELCRKHNKKIWEIVIDKEEIGTGLSKGEIMEKMKESLDIMRKALHKGLTEDVKSVSGLIGGDAKKVWKRSNEGKSVCGILMSRAISGAMAVLEVNASMGKIVAS